MRRAFTLIELMVVIVIVGMLLAILVPVFGKAREGARRALCANNLRQHGVARHLYLGDHNDCFPANGVPDQGGTDYNTFGGKMGVWWTWRYGAQYRALNRYLDIFNETSPNIEIFHCSDDRDKVVSVGDQLYNHFDTYGTSYQFNQRLCMYVPAGPGGPYIPRPLSTVTSSHTKVFMEMDDPSTMPGHGKKDWTNPFGKVPVMVLFVDGHVAGPILYSVDFEPYNPNTTKKALFDPNGTSSNTD